MHAIRLAVVLLALVACSSPGPLDPAAPSSASPPSPSPRGQVVRCVGTRYEASCGADLAFPLSSGSYTISVFGSGTNAIASAQYQGRPGATSLERFVLPGIPDRLPVAQQVVTPASLHIVVIVDGRAAAEGDFLYDPRGP